MALKIFKNKGESGAIPLSAENLNYNFQEVINLICPIGKVEIFYDNDDHSNYLGFTWERTGIGKAIVGIDSSDTDFNTIGKVGGEKTHNHLIPFGFDESKYLYFNGNSEFNPRYGSAIISSLKRGCLQFSNMTISENTNGRYALTNTQENLQPYQVFAIWKRIA